MHYNQTDKNSFSRFQLRSRSNIFSEGNDRNCEAVVDTTKRQISSGLRSFIISGGCFFFKKLLSNARAQGYPGCFPLILEYHWLQLLIEVVILKYYWSF